MYTTQGSTPDQDLQHAAQELAEVQQEGASVVQLLQQRQEALATTLGLQFPDMRNTTWQSESSVQAAAQSLTPQMTENKKKVGMLLVALNACHAWELLTLQTHQSCTLHLTGQRGTSSGARPVAQITISTHCRAQLLL